MADEAYLFLLPAGLPRLGAALGSVGALECAETPAVRGWLQAHGVSASSELVRVVPAGSGGLIPEDAERLPIPLSSVEEARVQQECAPSAVTDVEAELLEFRNATDGWEALVQRALTTGIPAPRIALLTGLDVREIARLIQA
ncbi:DUF6003 family protein [Streptomyces sp. NPDC088762]|uniref:DUF6003 family protein n=1 Tax=Streptomyces sp. NPDC088762 TaxID=3365891 RepID=UPI0038232933